MVRKLKKSAEGAAILDQMRSVIDQNADQIFITDAQGVIVYVNESLLKASGYEEEELLGKTPSIFKSGRHDESHYKQLWVTIRMGDTFRGQFVNKRKDERLIYVDETITPLKDESGVITNYVSVAREKLKVAQGDENVRFLMQTLKIEQEKLEQVLNMERKLNTIRNVNKLIDFAVKETASILEVEKCSLMFLDKNTEQLCIKGHFGLGDNIIKCARVSLGEPVAGLVAQMESEVNVIDIEKDPRFKRKNREGYRHKSFMSYPIQLDEELMGVINVADKCSDEDFVFCDLDEKLMSMIVCQIAATIGLSRLYREINYYNTIDATTNLFNYQHFTRTLDYELTRLKTFKGALSLLRIDLNNFRDYRQTHGQKKGDKLLKSVADAITKNLREVDIASRYAGDEFIIILPGAEVEAAGEIAENIKEQINGIKADRQVTVSIGLARYKDKMDRIDLISKVNTALFEAKQKGPNHIYF